MITREWIEKANLYRKDYRDAVARGDIDSADTVVDIVGDEDLAVIEALLMGPDTELPPNPT